MTALYKAGSRRVVGYVGSDGRSRLDITDPAPRVDDYEHTPGTRTAVVWSTAGPALLPTKNCDLTPDLASLHPSPGGSTFLILTLPPTAVYETEGFDFAAAAAEHLRLAPGIADRMEPDHPGFHTTDTIDYVILLAGEIWLVMDEGETCIKPGDAVVQLGARHAWQNRGGTPATLAVVLLGADRAG